MASFAAALGWLIISARLDRMKKAEADATGQSETSATATEAHDNAPGDVILPAAGGERKR